MHTAPNTFIPLGLNGGLFVRSGPKQVAECLLKWANSPNVDRRLFITTGTVAEGMRHIESRTPNPNRAFITSVGSDWSVLFNNDMDQFLPQAEIYVFCWLLKVDTAFFSYWPAGTPQAGSALFCFYYYETDVVERQIILQHDDGWDFSEQGKPLSFEDLQNYSARIKKERLTPDMLRSYAKRIGIPIDDKSAYGPTATLVSWRGQGDYYT